MTLLSKLMAAGVVVNAAEKKGGKCPFGHDAVKETDAVDIAGSYIEGVKLAQEKVASDINFPSQIYAADGVGKTPAMDQALYEDIVHDVIALYEAIDDTVADNHNPRSQFVGCHLRLAGHDFMDFRPDDPEHKGGMDGCMHFDDPDNAGLRECVGEFGTADLYEKYKDRVSLADYMVIIGEAVIGRAATDQLNRAYARDDYFREGTFAATLRDGFKWGRETDLECEWNIGRLPNPEHGCEGRGEEKPGLRQVFVDNVFRDDPDAWALTAAISGAHTVGSAKPENSGYNGFWSSADQSGIFNNDYYKSLIGKGWGPEPSVGGNPHKNQWRRVDAGHANAHKEVMLTTDICLAFHRNKMLQDCRLTFAKDKQKPQKYDCTVNFFKDGLDIDPSRDKCCAWPKLVPLKAFGTIDGLTGADGYTNFCGIKWKEGEFEWPQRDGKMGGIQPQNSVCCQDMGSVDLMQDDCDRKYYPTGVAITDVYDFVKNEELWLKTFARAWHIATENGQDLQFLSASGPDRSAVGDLESFDCRQWPINHDPSRKLSSCLSQKVRINNRGRGVRPCYESPDQLCPDAGYMRSCYNGHRLLSAQKREWREAGGFNHLNDNTAYYRDRLELTNPQMSSTEGKFTPEQPLKGQNTWLTPRDREYYESTPLPYDWGIRSSMKDGMFQTSSCASTAQANSGDSGQFWSADFTNGAADVYKFAFTTDSDKQLVKNVQGAKVYVDDKLCNVIQDSHNKRKTIYTGYCMDPDHKDQSDMSAITPINGSSIRIELDGKQLVICNIEVHFMQDGFDSLETQCYKE